VSWGELTASTVLAVIAVAGVLWPFVRPVHSPLQQTPTPLEEQRASVIRALRQLDQDHAAGSIDDATYSALRHETERRAVSVLHELETQDGSGTQIGGHHDLTRSFSTHVTHHDRPQEAFLRRHAVPFAFAVLIVGLAGSILAAALRARSVTEPVDGAAASDAATGSIDFLETRVRQHPQDIGARLDLAQRYLAARDVRAAIAQYVSVLSLDRTNLEALARLGYLLYVGGKEEVGTRLVDRALSRNAMYPEALYYKGLILLKDAGSTARAARYLERYIRAAPYGSHREEVNRLLASMRR
jgi:tetratricopeptide (TPR) repeat protein